MIENQYSLESFQEEIEIEYPRIVSSVFRRCRTERSGDLGSRHKSLIDLAEIFIKFLGITQVQECRQKVHDLKSRLPQKSKTLEFLERPSMGGWMGLLRILCNIDINEEATYWTHKISSWYSAGKTDENRSIIEALDDIEGVRTNPKSGVPHAEILNGLVNYRNKQFAHAANFRRDQLRRRIQLLEPILAYLLQSASFLKEMDLIYVNRAEISESDQWLIHGTQMDGVTEEPVHVLSDEKLSLKEVYLCRVQEGEIQDIPVSLTPFILRKTNQETNTEELFVYNDAWRTRLEYISYESGAHYYHEELHKDLEELIDLQLHSGKEEREYESLSEEERSEYADRYFKRAMVHREEGRYEDAIEFLEHSAQLDRRATTFFEIAKLQNKLDDPTDSILQTVQNALEIRPDYEEAISFQRQLQEEAHSTSEEDTSDTSDDAEEPAKEHVLEAPTILHACMPHSIRGYTRSAVITALVVWFLGSAGLEYASGNFWYLASLGLQFVFCCLAVLGTYARDMLLNMRAPLSLQLDNMRLDRFERWYDQHLENIFGKFRFNSNGNLDVYGSYQEEKLYHTFGIAWAIVFTAGGFILSGSYQIDHVLVKVKRLVDWTLVIIGSWPGLRLFVMTTNMVLDFSSLSLRPSLTKMSDEGVNAFGPLLVYITLLVSVAFEVYLGIAFILVDYQEYWDFVCFGVGSFAFATWSILLPFSVHYTMVNAKKKVVNRYKSTIEKSFNEFMDNPNEKNLDRYEWLMRQRKVVDQVVTWPLNGLQSFVIISCNLLVFGSLGLYVLHRLNYIDKFLAFLGGA